MTRESAAPRGLLRPPPLVGALAFAKLALLLSCASAYGYSGDELYALARTHHLAWGYPSGPPLSTLVLAAATRIYGASILSVRVVPALAGAFVVTLTARLARRFGASVLGQGIAAVSAVVAPELLSIDHVYSARALEVLAVTAIAGLVARALEAPDEDSRWAWAPVGAGIGLALENSVASLVVVAGLAVGLAVESLSRSRGADRRLTRGAVVALGVATIVTAPNLAWQWAHGGPARAVIAGAIRHPASGADVREFLAAMLPRTSPVGTFLLAMGLVMLLRGGRLQPYRPLGVACLVSLGLFAFGGEGAIPHAASVYPILFAAAAAALDPWLARRRWRYAVLAALVVVPGIAAVPLTLPVLPVARYESYARSMGAFARTDAAVDAGALPAHFATMFGWPELVRAVTTVVGTLAPEEREEVVVLAGDVGEAGALDFLGAVVRLPPVISGHGDFWAWGPAGASGKVLIAVGGDDAFLRAHFRSVEVVTVFGHSLALPAERHLRIYLCRDAVAPLDVMWAEFKAAG